MNIIQRINLANNENERNKIIKAIFFFEINIIIFFFVIIIRNNRFISKHRVLDIGNEPINIIFSDHLLEDMNLSTDRNAEDDEKYFNNYKNNSTFNFNNEEYLLKDLLSIYYDDYVGMLENLYYHKNNSNIDLRNATILKLFSNESNKVYIRFNKAKSIFNRQTFLVIDLRNYINDLRYVLYANISELNNKNDIINKRFIVKSLFSGVLFDGIIDNKINLSAFAELEFQTKDYSFENYDNKTPNKTYIIDRSGFTLLLLIPDYGLNLKIKSKFEIKQNEKNDKNELQMEFYIYILIIIFLLITNAIGVRCLIRSIKNKESLISAISLESFSLNFICHFYFTFFHLMLFFIRLYINLIFAITVLFSIINLFYDFSFINLFWRLKLRGLTCFQGFKLKLRVFILSFLFIILFYLFPNYLDNINLLFLYFSFKIWSPQILHNIVNNNRYIYPLFYIFFTTLEKVFYLFLIVKMEKPTSIQLNKYVIIISFTYLSLSIVILYLQTFLGPRFMLPLKCYKKEFIIYISYEELLKEKSKSNLYKEICVICLSNISDIAKKEEKNDKNKASNENKNDNNIISNLDNPMEANNVINNSSTTSRIDLVSSINKQLYHNKSNVSQSLRVIKNIIKLFINVLGNLGLNLKDILSEGLFSFYIIKENKNKEIMLLPCGHIFHSICLNQWFRRKRICPICSRSIP